MLQKIGVILFFPWFQQPLKIKYFCFWTTMVMSMNLVVHEHRNQVLYEHMNLVVYEHMNLVINIDQIMAMSEQGKI
jgi:hypothetical protein